MSYLERLAEAIEKAVPGDDGAKDRTLFLIYAVLLLAKGEQVTREDVHNAWVAWVLGRDETHESAIPFSDLPREVQDEDSPYVIAIREVASRLN